MSQEEMFAKLMGTVMQQMALQLLELSTDDDGPKHFLTRDTGDLMHLRVKSDQGAVLYQVSGEDTDALAWQLLLACLHNISIEKLKALHKRPLKRALQATKGKGDGVSPKGA